MAPLRVMSFNVRYGTADDGPHSWPFRRSAALGVVRSFAPDVLALQEALGFQIEEFGAGLGVIGVGRDDGEKTGEHCAILYDESRLRPVDSGTFWFSETPSQPGSRHPECYHPRICTWAIFEDGDSSFALYNLHLDNESARSREQSVRQLLATMKPDHPLIVTGDFNAGESDPCIESLRSVEFRDSFRVLHPETVESATFHGYGTGGNSEKIDYIWVDRSWSVLEAEIVVGRVEWVWPSDHYPVTAVLSRLPKALR